MGREEGAVRIAASFAAANAEGRAALMPYMMAGFPDRETSLAVARGYVESGVDLVEVGVPFSDPLADGPVIHAAATRALESGAGFETALEVVRELGDGVSAVLMCYVNMILVLGPERFAGTVAEAGVAGVIVPDLPLGEGAEVRAALDSAGVALVPLVAPTTPADRRRRICAQAEGFVYVVSSTGTTGERDELPTGLCELVDAVRADSVVPVAVGFGIGTPEQAATVGQVADGVIIGSRLVRAVEEAGSPLAAASEVARFLRQAREAMAG